MKISYNWLKEFIDLNITKEELVATLTMLGLEVDELIDLGAKYNKFFVGRVTSCQKHPNADKLTLCKVDIGSSEYEIVCGAPNVALGQNVALGIAGAVVPAAGFTLEDRKIRGHSSQGMICSQAELELGEDSDGIWVLPESAPVGSSLADYLALNDVILDISITPNKADCLGHYGVARDLAAYYDLPIHLPSTALKESDVDVRMSANVAVKDIKKCPRYTARVIRNIKVTHSPNWMKSRLIAVGLRPVNAIVDTTNYVMMELGHPMHAFNLNRLSGHKINVRTIGDKTEFTTLDGKVRNINSEMLMICDGEKPVAIAGVMGGENSEISDGTNNILLESAYFEPTTVRKTAKKLGINSDSSYRFERGVDPEMAPIALDRAAKLINEICGGEIQRNIIDVFPNPVEKNLVKIRFERTRSIIGKEIDNSSIKKILQNLHFIIMEESDSHLLVEVPSHRHDVSLEVDLIEEVARMVNYDTIEPVFVSELRFDKSSVSPQLSMPPLRRKIRDYLVARGFNETLNPYQTSPKSASIYTDNPVIIANPLGEHLSIMRPSLISSMTKSINHNIRLANKDLALYEIGRAFSRGTSDRSFLEGFEESEYLTIALTGKDSPISWYDDKNRNDFYAIKGLASQLIEHCGFHDYSFEIGKADKVFSKNVVELCVAGKRIGRLGELSSKFLKEEDIAQRVYLAELCLSELYQLEPKASVYSKVSPFPEIDRDLAFVLDKNVRAAEILDVIEKNGSEILKDYYIFDVYEGENIGNEKKSVAVSLKFSSVKRTLKDTEADEATNRIMKAVEKKFNAELRK